MRRAERAREMLRRLEPDGREPRTELDHRTAFELLIATILSAQCTDARVNAVTKTLFLDFPDAAALAAADTGRLEQLVRPTGFFRRKAKAIKACSQALVADFGGEVPNTLDELTTLPGVARKTANVVLANWFHRTEGIIVDVHVHRVSNRTGLSRQKDANQVEADLMRLIPREHWVWAGDALLLHGRYTCTARKPKCDRCPLDDICPKYGV